MTEADAAETVRVVWALVTAVAMAWGGYRYSSQISKVPEGAGDSGLDAAQHDPGVRDRTDGIEADAHEA